MTNNYLFTSESVTDGRFVEGGPRAFWERR